MDVIQRVRAREILNAKGKPTVEVELSTQSGIVTVASSPSGASTGANEAFELYDRDARYRGFGVRKAVQNVNDLIAPALLGKNVQDQAGIDGVMRELDGTPNKSRLGGNAILAVSVAAAKAGAKSVGLPVYRYLAATDARFKLPGIVATVLAGGSFSVSGLEFEDYMYVLQTDGLFSETLERLSSLRHTLGEVIAERYGQVPIDGGALAPPITDSQTAFGHMMAAARRLGCASETGLGLDLVAGEYYDRQSRSYCLGGRCLDEDEAVAFYRTLGEAYPIGYWEDAFEEDAFEAFAKLKRALPGAQIVGDDLFTTNAARVRKGAAADSANGLLVKINQAGTVSETLEACDAARAAGMELIVSMRSGETADDFIADLAVALGARQVKLGSPVVLERNVKYNRLLRIEEDLLET